MLIELQCLRHGQPELSDCLLGRTDCAVTKRGRRDMERAVDELAPFDSIASSPLKRCLAFAEDLANRHRLPIIVSDDFEEMDFGAWDGVPWDELAKEYPARLAQFWQEPAAVPPDGESLAEFISRVRAGRAKLVSRLVHAARLAGAATHRCLLVTHAGVIKALVALALGVPLENGGFVRRLELGYASLTHLSVFVDDVHWWRLHGLNQYPTTVNPREFLP